MITLFIILIIIITIAFLFRKKWNLRTPKWVQGGNILENFYHRQTRGMSQRKITFWTLLVSFILIISFDLINAMVSLSDGQSFSEYHLYCTYIVCFLLLSRLKAHWPKLVPFSPYMFSFGVPGVALYFFGGAQEMVNIITFQEGLMATLFYGTFTGLLTFHVFFIYFFLRFEVLKKIARYYFNFMVCSQFVFMFFG